MNEKRSILYALTVIAVIALVFFAFQGGDRPLVKLPNHGTMASELVLIYKEDVTVARNNVPSNESLELLCSKKSGVNTLEGFNGENSYKVIVEDRDISLIPTHKLVGETVLTHNIVIQTDSNAISLVQLGLGDCAVSFTVK